MASIVGKKQGDKTYYYLVESARVGGKPRIVSQRYLGQADDIVAAGRRGDGRAGPHPPSGLRGCGRGVGDAGAAAGGRDRRRGRRAAGAPTRRRRWGPTSPWPRSTGSCDPCSKLAFAEWWAKTAGDRWVRLPGSALDHRRFWDAMDAIGEAELTEIERRIVAAMVEAFGVDLSGLVLDMTNFATYIDSANDRAPIAQRGHAKQKRSDLRLVGLGLVVSTDGGIPLVSHAYPGNRPDVTQFPAMVEELAAPFRGLCGGDAGPSSPWSLTPARTPPTTIELFDGLAVRTSSARCRPLTTPTCWPCPKAATGPSTSQRFPGLSAFETTKVVFGAERRIVVTHSETLHDKQSAGLRPDPGQGPPPALRARRPPGPGQDPQDPTTRSRPRSPHILKPRWALPGHLHHPHRRARPRSCASPAAPNPAARAALEEELFGKRILFTDKAPRASPPPPDRGRLPLPRSRRERLPPDERPQGRVLLAHVPLDRPEDPGPRLLLRARP